MKQNFFDDIDNSWEDLISDVYNNPRMYKPKYKFDKNGKKTTVFDPHADRDFFDKELVLDDDLNKIEYNTFINFTGLKGKLIIPDSVEEIDKQAFYGCKGFTSLKLSSSLKRIGMLAFNECENMAGELVIPDSVEVIDKAAFANCINFTSLKLSSSIKRIESRAFYYCSGIVGDVYIPESIEYIGEGVFKNCYQIERIYLPSSTKSDLYLSNDWLDGFRRGEIIYY